MLEKPVSYKIIEKNFLTAIFPCGIDSPNNHKSPLGCAEDSALHNWIDGNGSLKAGGRRCRRGGCHPGAAA